MIIKNITKTQIKNIYYGWSKLIFSGFKLNKGAKEKLNHCKKCKLKSGGWCNPKKCDKVVNEYMDDFFILRKKGEEMCGCGCYLLAKINSESKCPLGKF